MVKYRKSEAKEASKASFRGVWAAITTPFTPDGEVDEAGIRANMRRLTNDLKIDGVFCTGVMGEYWSLRKEERKRIVEVVVEEAKDKCLVIAHTAHHSAHETIDLTLHAREVGADFAIMINPYFPPANEAMIYEWFEFVADRVDIGIWMFDTSYAGYGFSAPLTAKIAEIENICGIKIVRPIDHYLEVKRLTGGSIVMSQPNEEDWLTMLRDYGQQVHMSSPTPYLYQVPGYLPMREYTDLGVQGKFEEARKVSDALQPLREINDKWLRTPWANHKIIQIAYLKAWCELLGQPAGPVRPPLVQLTQAERDGMRADLERVGLLARAAAAVNVVGSVQ